MSNWNTFNFSSIDAVFSSVASRGHQSIIRVYVDYPDENSDTIQKILPAFLISGTTVIDNNDGTGVHPDYDNANLIKALQQLIAALGAKYDGDNRIAVWQTGLLGHWGEWHNYPTTDFASTGNQKLILDAFTTAFQKTKLQVRYPNKIGGYVPSQLNMGYYDDSFMEDTYGPNDYDFSNQLSSVNGQDIWKTQMMGGELYPPYQKCAFGSSACSGALDWYQCANLTKPAWMWNNYAFSGSYTATQKTNALVAASLMGYQLHVSSLKVSQTCNGNQCNVVATVSIVNKGNTPFYYPISVQLSIRGVTTTQSLDTTPGSSNTYDLSISGVPSVAGQTVFISLTSPFVLTQSPVKFATSEAQSNGALSVLMASTATTQSTFTTSTFTQTPGSTSGPTTSILGAVNGTTVTGPLSGTSGSAMVAVSLALIALLLMV
ncbi:hypothetical protein PROFUN_10188 [Planoprotostelium fungivorum]|uniref:DUF4874 domain-containing protein n=1 Tax=Planoprotostelium fungivorum TaxID=1890364 RepID=A0A2P6MQ34_9EUKA|nr:hypothetical protein PROFUN_10188 [Planoprotostelium fungivorum]